VLTSAGAEYAAAVLPAFKVILAATEALLRPASGPRARVHDVGAALADPAPAALSEAPARPSGARKYSNLPFASSLNGSCTNVCPVKINIHEQIYAWRRELVKQHEVPLAKKTMMQAAGELLPRGAAPAGADLPSMASGKPGRRAMSRRDEILAQVRANLPKAHRPLSHVPLFDGKPPEPLLVEFKENLHRMGGIFIDPPRSGDPVSPIRAKLADAKVVCSTVPEVAGNRDIAAVRTPRDLADVDFAVVRAAFAVAETGSVLLDDAGLNVNAVAYPAQHLIVLLDPDEIVVNLHHAYRRREFRERHYANFHTGPSATADIEGVLIHGAQGVRSLSVLLVKRPGTGNFGD
jgi:L-lactate dehydrogenase complex protein LldG